MGGDGVTRNISRNGALIESGLLPPLNTELTLTIILNALPGDDLRAKLAGRGLVKHLRQAPRRLRAFGVEVRFRTESAT